MSVLPLLLEGEGRTVVERKEEFIADGRRVLILGLDHAQMEANAGANVSYDLRIGSEYRDHREEGKRFLEESDTITLRPGAALIIQTEETICLPRALYGIIAPKVSLLQKGVSNTFSKVDPGYSGPLLISLFNLGKATIELKRGDQFCAISFLEVAPGARLYNKGAKQIRGGSALTRIQRFTDWLEARSGYVHLVLALATIALIIATAALAVVTYMEYSRHIQ